MKEPKTESDLWNQLKPMFKKIDPNAHLVRVGSDTNLGIPDIYYSIKYKDEITNGFIELKMGKFMKRSEILKAHFSPAQFKWKESRSGSITHVFIYYAGYLLKPDEWSCDYTLNDISFMNKVTWPCSDIYDFISFLNI